MNKTEKIILGIVVAVVLILIVYFGVINKGPKVVYYLTKSGNTGNILVEDYKTFSKLATNIGMQEKIENKVDFSKSNYTDIFTEDYFNEKKVAIITTYEDTSNDYTYSVDNIKYNKDKTEATIYYTDHRGEYAGTLKSSWYNCMIVELPLSVKDVSFEKNSDK